MREARAPFHFNTSVHLLRIEPERAANLAELLEGLHRCRDASIFQHTFRTLQEHHFIRGGFSNDFAHWASTACHELGLAERLASVDVRDATSIEMLRARIIEIVDHYLTEKPKARERAALEPFYFCASETVVVPTPFVARNLAEFAAAISQVGVHSIHYHFIEARLRLKLKSNDFSVWLEEQMDLAPLARRLARIDIHTSTLQDARRRIVRILESALP